FEQPYRFVAGDPNEFQSLVSGGNTFLTFPFEVSVLNDEDREPESVIRIQNIDDRIGSTLIGLPSESVSVTLQVVMRETPDVIEYDVVNLELVDIEINAIQITGRLMIRGLTTEPCPGRVL